MYFLWCNYIEQWMRQSLVLACSTNEAFETWHEITTLIIDQNFAQFLATIKPNSQRKGWKCPVTCKKNSGWWRHFIETLRRQQTFSNLFHFFLHFLKCFWAKTSINASLQRLKNRKEFESRKTSRFNFSVHKMLPYIKHEDYSFSSKNSILVSLETKVHLHNGVISFLHVTTNKLTFYLDDSGTSIGLFWVNIFKTEIQTKLSI